MVCVYVEARAPIEPPMIVSANTHSIGRRDNLLIPPLFNHDTLEGGPPALLASRAWGGFVSGHRQVSSRSGKIRRMRRLPLERMVVLFFALIMLTLPPSMASDQPADAESK